MDGMSIARAITTIQGRSIIEGNLEDPQATSIFAITYTGSTYAASLTGDPATRFVYTEPDSSVGPGDTYTMRLTVNIIINGAPEPSGVAIGYSVANGTLLVLDVHNRRVRRSSDVRSVVVS